MAYVVDGMDRNVLYLSYEQVRTMFHEFGHALNIALSDTNYQYHSCARASMDIAEIPSHFAELYLKNYDFVKKFAFKPQGEDLGENELEPIDIEIFQKMMFCDEIFRFMSFEETLFFTSLDIDLNSFQKDDIINEEALLKITEQNFKSAFSCDRLNEET